MTAAKDTAYPYFKPEISTVELERNYTPTEDELKFVQGLVSGPAPQTAMMIHLKMLQVMGQLMKLPAVPQVIRDHIARCLTFARSPTLKELARFERGGNRATKIRKLREFLNIQPLQEKGFAWLKHVAEEAAEIQHLVADIINVMLEELVRHRYELPVFETLKRAAVAAREKSNDQYFNAIASQLGPETKARIDGLMRVEAGAQTSAWHSLKRGRPSCAGWARTAARTSCTSLSRSWARSCARSSSSSTSAMSTCAGSSTLRRTRASSSTTS
jgi:hypothetical protein